MSNEVEVIFLQRGDQGEEVRILQETLASLGFDPGPLDGIFGPRTEAALISFQRYAGLLPDGFLTETTWAVLSGNVPGPAQATPVPEVLRELAPAPAPVVSPPGVAPTLFQRITQLAQDAGARFGVDPLLILSIIRTESNFKPAARNLLSGAAGLMQLTSIAIEDLAQRFGIQVTDPFDIAQNIQGGTALFAAYLNQFGGDVAKGLAAYNAGPTRVLRWVQRQGEAWLGTAFRETRNYVQNILAAWQFAQVSGGEPAQVVQASLVEPTGPLTFLPEAIQPELATVESFVEGFVETVTEEPARAAGQLAVVAGGILALWLLSRAATSPRQVPAR